jgi:hypothetical protein
MNVESVPVQEGGKKTKGFLVVSFLLHFPFLHSRKEGGFFSPTITNKTPRGKPKVLEME